jgi:MHS family proline/betaine transporter-like MFS transporter
MTDYIQDQAAGQETGDQPSTTEIRRVTVAAALGTVVEYYDFAVYAYMAAVIAPLFFPADDPVVGLLLTFAAFASSYLVRPLGGMIFGSIGDKHGRKNVLSVVILIMSAATTAIGLLPTYAQIGIAAPILLTLLRLVQGLSIGGEFGGAAAYLGEFAPAPRRGFYLGWLMVANGLGYLSGALVASTLAASVNDDALSSWGWRLPFMLALPMGLVGVYLRRRLSDTPRFEQASHSDALESSPLLASLRQNYTGILLTIGLLAGMTTCSYLFLVYVPSHLTTVLDYSPSQALFMTTIGILAFCVAGPILAILCDRIGRRPVYGVAITAMAALLIPTFRSFEDGDLVVVGLMLAVVTALTMGSAVATVPMLVELFATSTRYTSLALGWNIAAALFGGATPLVVTALVASTGYDTAPAFYGVTCCALSLIALAFVKETRGIDLRIVDAKDIETSA